MTDGGPSQAQRDLDRQQAGRDAPCSVCGEPVGPAPIRCPVCETPHHFDCWEFGGGCGVYGCAGRVQRRAPTERPVLPGKLGMPVKRAGAYAGHLWAPPFATFQVFAFEALAIPLLFMGDPLGWFCLAWMFAALLWIPLSSEHFYVDFDRGMITKAKALLGRDIWEWDIAPLEDYAHLALAEVPKSKQPARRIVAVPKQGDELMELSPPMPTESEALEEATDLLRRIQASQAFAVRMPGARFGLDHEPSGEQPVMLIGE